MQQSDVGYWLVRQSDSKRFFISTLVDVPALEKVADRVLSDEHGYGYWIDFCYGLDVNRNVAWMNLDLTDRFI